MDRKKPNPQQKYRKNQYQKGLVRYEIQITQQARDEFERLVTEAAEEYAEPWSPRQRKAKARASIFDELTKGIRHQFFELKDRIEALQAEIKALSPSFFKAPVDSTPLPEAIAALPDDSEQLKQQLAKLHRESQQAKLKLVEAERRQNQYLELYETATTHNEKLEKILKENDLERFIY